MSKYVRVSDILSQLQDFSGIDPMVLSKKAELGTEVHEAIQNYVYGGFPYLSSDKANLYYQSYIKWHEGHRPHYEWMEKRFFDDALMITGQIDGYCCFDGNNKPMIIDYKTSYTANLNIWSLQAHFYWYLLKQSGIDPIGQMSWIHLHRTGKIARTHTFEFSEEKLQQCIELTHKYWENYNNARDI